ncbi:glucose-6-phosphate dehydrogenase assembly protein OpcA [Nocardioides insulae]|uniref:glucose-6-phosphate dehydrogenase assembly protein OpcA n=1 Tax=Nocardioides insulae TaxID=394734 RepID=UPI00041C5B13|nr:glucose-6-phosphate dehydrogenase assembly protein OpcA [Nocardioides insulae]
MSTLRDTDAAEIAAEFVSNRRRAGSPAMGMVMTLVVVVEESVADQAMAAARTASREHPARVLGVIRGVSDGPPQVDAEVGIGDGWGGEHALIRLSGAAVGHAESVVLPLLLPDSPVAVWWPDRAPAEPAADPLGQLGRRRITDAAAPGGHGSPLAALTGRCRAYTAGDTDLAWTRLTPWRALLAASLDHPAAGAVTAAEVTGEPGNPSADLLAAWLGDRLGVPVERTDSDGPGLTDVVLDTDRGRIGIRRTDGRLATVTSPGHPDRPVALKRRSLPELLAEELRRLDEDDIYAATVQALLKETTP